jgi:hypothetical protein
MAFRNHFESGQQSRRNSPHPTMNIHPQHYYCPIPGCPHSSIGNKPPFTTKLSFINHLNNTNHTETHHLTDLSSCTTSGIFHCCCSNYPSSPKTFFPSLRSLRIHTETFHPTPCCITRDTNAPSHPHASQPTLLQLNIATTTLHESSPRNTTTNRWIHGLSFIGTTYDHEPPDFGTTWRHFLKGRNKASFITLQSAIIRAIVSSYAETNSPDISAPFWWLLLHLDMLIFAPSTTTQRNDKSIQECIHDRIEATFSGDIAYLYDSAMAVNRLSQNSRSTSSSNRCAQRAADSDDYRTAVA